MFKNNSKAFTMIEVMIGILIFSVVILGGFKALSSVQYGKIALMGEVDMEKESYYFTEKLFETIKRGGTLDYEEYFLRKARNSNTFTGGHLLEDSGFGNFGFSGSVGTSSYGDGYYYCVSGNGSNMGTEGCYDNAYNTKAASQLGTPQRYGQYSFQFIDYNSNMNNDTILGDEDGDGNVIGDEDDEYLGKGPEAFNSGSSVTELYLISGNKKKKTLFRWNVVQDPLYSDLCNFGTGQSPTGTGCLGNIEFLELEGMDWGFNHDKTGFGVYDGVVDTWLISEKLSGVSDLVAGSTSDNYWVPMFPDSINVKEFEIYAYPNKDINHAWADSSTHLNIAPYVRLNMVIAPRRIPDGSSDLRISTTISLTDIFSK